MVLMRQSLLQRFDFMLDYLHPVQINPPQTKYVAQFVIGPPNGPVVFCSRASVVVVCHRRLLLSVTLPVGGLAGLRTCGRSATARPGMWAVGRPTLHDRPVQLRSMKATCRFLWTLISYLT